MRKVLLPLIGIMLCCNTHLLQAQYIEKAPDYISPLLRSKKDTLGVVYLTDKMPKLTKRQQKYNPENIHSIRKRGNRYSIQRNGYIKYSAIRTEYHSTAGFSQVNNLPEVQAPLLSVNADNFFRTGSFFSNQVIVDMPFFDTGYADNVLSISLKQNRNNTPVSDSYRDSYQGNLLLKKIEIGRFTSSLGVIGRSTYDRLMNNGASHARLLQQAMSTPNYTTGHLPDKNKNEELVAYAQTHYQYLRLKADALLIFDKQWANRTIGREATEQPFITRREELSTLTGHLKSDYTFRRYGSDFHLTGEYRFNRTDNHVSRMESSIFNRFRNSHELSYGVYFFHRGNLFEFKNRHYMSNTVRHAAHFLPSAGTRISLTNFFKDALGIRAMNSFYLFASASKSLGESPLTYRNPGILSTRLTAPEALNSFYEDQDILMNHPKMIPETYQNYEVGFYSQFFNRKLRTEFTYFRNRTNDMIAPVSVENRYELSNIGNIRNYGWTLLNELRLPLGRRDELFIKLSVSQFKSKVIETGNEQTIYPLAGFSDTYTAFALGKPLGAIYHRGEQIGNPTPDFIANLSPFLSWKKFNLSFNLTYSHGGDRWNGTKAYSDQLSSLSVKAASDYIEDATFLQMSDVSLSYLVIDDDEKFIKKLKVGLQAQNLFTITSYSGSDPSSTLFGYETGKGLDLFNMPAIRKYSLSVSLTF